jgi:hypothetical protein
VSGRFDQVSRFADTAHRDARRPSVSLPAPIGPLSSRVLPAHTIFLIRHAEIPDDGSPFAVDSDGASDEFGLIPHGWQRAGALARLFAPDAGSTQLTSPSRLIAPAFGDPQVDKSRRMHATLTGISALLNLEIQTPCGEGEERTLAEAVTAETTGVTLICWGHTFIPTLARHIVPDADAQIPNRWPDKRFDVVWTFVADGDTGAYRFGQVPQRLLAGDSEAPITD